MTASADDLLPLSPVAFEILLTLHDADAHGYHIMQDVERRTAGAMTLHPGTLYRALARLLDQGVIEETDVEEGEPSRPPRRGYALTRLGRAVLAAEAARLERQVRALRARRIAGRSER